MHEQNISRRDLLKATVLAGVCLNLSEGRLALAGSYSTHVRVDEQIARIKKANGDKTGKKIAVLGAGMAGLAAAFQLRELGHDVTVFEAEKSRVGGRVWTWGAGDGARDERRGFPFGSYHEFGAMRIPATHDYTRHYVEMLHLKLRDFVTSHDDAKCYYLLRGAVERIENAGKLGSAPTDPQRFGKTFYQQLGYNLSYRQHLIASEQVAPAILGAVFLDAVNGLGNDDVESLFGLRPITNHVRQLDGTSLGQYLLEKLQQEDALQANLRGREDALELIGATTGLEVWWDKSLGMFLRDEITATGDGLQEIIGGMDQLPRALKAFAETAGVKFRMGTKVSGIEVDRETPDEIPPKLILERLKYSKSDPKPEDPAPASEPIDPESFEYVICTLPFPVMELMNLKGFTARKQRAIRNLGYASSTKVLLHCKERFWECDGIRGGASLSDKITRATYYPSDRAEILFRDPPSPLRPRSHYVTNGRIGTPRQTILRMSTKNEHQPGVLVASYSWGRSAELMGRMSKALRRKTCIDVISSFSSNHARVAQVVGEEVGKDYESMYWNNHPWSKAAFCFMRPGDLEAYFEDTIRPEGRTHFAGEHCSLDQAWIQGALISALRAVEEVVASP